MGCPACHAEDVEVLREAVSGVTVRCVECGHVWTQPRPRVRQHEVGLVLSAGEGSRSGRLHVDADEPVRVGDEFELDGHRFLVTAIDRLDGVQSTQSPAQEVKSVYAKQFDTVALKVTLNEGSTTRSLAMDVEPERQIRVGDLLDIDGQRMVVKALKSDENRTLRRGHLAARHIVRAFCDPSGSPNRVASRSRS